MNDNERAEIFSKIIEWLANSNDIDTAILTLSEIVERVTQED